MNKTTEEQTKAATDYANGMDLYGAIISLQEAQMWLESGYLEHVETNIKVALVQLHSMADRQK